MSASEILSIVDKVGKTLSGQGKDGLYFVFEPLYGEKKPTSLMELYTKLKIERCTDPLNAALLIVIVLKMIEANKPAEVMLSKLKADQSSVSALESFKYINEETRRKMKARSFFVCVCHELTEEVCGELRVRFCAEIDAHPENFTDNYKLFRELEKHNKIRYDNRSGLEIFSKTFQDNPEYASSLRRFNKFFNEEWPSDCDDANATSNSNDIGQSVYYPPALPTNGNQRYLQRLQSEPVQHTNERVPVQFSSLPPPQHMNYQQQSSATLQHDYRYNNQQSPWTHGSGYPPPPPGDFDSRNIPPHSYNLPSGSHNLRQPPPPGSYDLRQPPPGSYDSRQPPPGSYDSRQLPPGSYDSRQPPPGSYDSRQPPPGFYDSRQPPPGSYDSRQPPPGSYDSRQPPPGSYDSRQPPPGSYDSRQPPPGSYDSRNMIPSDQRHSVPYNSPPCDLRPYSPLAPPNPGYPPPPDSMSTSVRQDHIPHQPTTSGFYYRQDNFHHSRPPPSHYYPPVQSTPTHQSHSPDRSPNASVHTVPYDVVPAEESPHSMHHNPAGLPNIPYPLPDTQDNSYSRSNVVFRDDHRDS